MLDNEVLTRRAHNDSPSKIVTPGAERKAFAHAREHDGLSESMGRSSACDLIGASHRVIRHRSSRSDDGPLRQRLRELAPERRRSAIAAWAICSLGRAWCRTTGNCCGYNARRTCVSGVAVVASAPLAAGRRWCCWMDRTSGGRSNWALAPFSASLRIRLRYLRMEPTLPHPVRGRRLYARVSGARVARELTRVTGLRGKPHTR